MREPPDAAPLADTGAAFLPGATVPGSLSHAEPCKRLHTSGRLDSLCIACEVPSAGAKRVVGIISTAQVGINRGLRSCSHRYISGTRPVIEAAA